MMMTVLTTVLLVPILLTPSCTKRDEAGPASDGGTGVVEPGQVSEPYLGNPKLPTETLVLGGVKHEVELAYTESARRLGLMYRESMPPDTGMLFVFGRTQPLTFHMENCRMDIDIVFIRATGQIDSVMTMKAPPPGEQTELYNSHSAVMYALELAAGQAEALGLKPGDVIEIPRRVKRIQADP